MSFDPPANWATYIARLKLALPLCPGCAELNSAPQPPKEQHIMTLQQRLAWLATLDAEQQTDAIKTAQAEINRFDRSLAQAERDLIHDVGAHEAPV